MGTLPGSVLISNHQLGHFAGMPAFTSGSCQQATAKPCGCTLPCNPEDIVA